MYRLIMMDYKMPFIDGLETTLKINQILQEGGRGKKHADGLNKKES